MLLMSLHSWGPLQLQMSSTLTRLWARGTATLIRRVRMHIRALLGRFPCATPRSL